MKLGIHQNEDKTHAEPKATLRSRRPFGWENPPSPRPAEDLSVQMDRAARYGHSLFGLSRAAAPQAPSAAAPIQLNKAQEIYDASGREKWREYIDAKDHETALKELEAGLLSHPGEYYDYQRTQDGRVKTGNHWKAFQKADAYVSQSIVDQTPLDAREYLKIHMLAAEGYESPAKKGWRDAEVTWGLRDPTPEKIENLTDKGLGVEQGQDRATVTVPAPDRPMGEQVQELFGEFHELRQELPAAAAFRLYQKLEALHPTKDASSRTNHLILNRLLAEYGLAPAILNEPNTPEQSYLGAVDNILAGSRRGHQIAMGQHPSSVEELQKSREALRDEEEMNRRVEALMSGNVGGLNLSRGASSSQRPTGRSSTQDDEKMNKIRGMLFGKKKT